MSEINKDYLGTSSTNFYEVNQAQLRNTLLNDSLSYIQYALSLTVPEEELMPVPDFHINMFDLFTSTSIKKVAVACPRAHSKTGIMKISVCRIIHEASLRGQDLNIGYLSNSSALAVKSLLDIKNLLTHQKMEMVFGVPQFSIEQEGRGEYAFSLNGCKYHLTSFGANSQIRGFNVNNRRLDLLIVDDLENRQENESDILYDKLKQWFYSDVFKALGYTGRICQIGNIVNKNSIVDENCADPSWHSMKLSAIKSDGSPLWPALYTIEELLEEYNSYARKGMGGQWCAEMLNDPEAANTLQIDVSKIGYKDDVQPDNSDHLYGFITVDPAISSESWGHAQTVAVHCYYENPEPYWQIVATSSVKGESPVLLYEKLHYLADAWSVSLIGIEAEAFQASLLPIFEYLDKLKKREGLVEYIPLKTMKKSKASRIQSFLDFLYKKIYYLSHSDKLSVAQFLKFNPTRKDNSDDLIDVESYGCQMLDLHKERIVAAKRRIAINNFSKEQAARDLIAELQNLNY